MNGGRSSGELAVGDPDGLLASAVVAGLGLGVAVEVERLGGMTNRNFRLVTAGGAFHVRLPGAGTDAYIDRAAEAHNARRAADLGLNCEVLLLDPDGTMVCAFVDGDVVGPEHLADQPARLEQAAKVLWRLHTGAGVFAGRFDPLAIIERHRTALGDVPGGVDDLIGAVEGFDLGAPLAPCHNDPWSMNFVWGDTGVVLVDWEYSGMNDPAWDLAHLSVESGLDADDHERLLHAYCGGDSPAEVRRRVDLLRGVTDVVWGLWALVQHADGNDATDFEAYAADRFTRAATWW
jgi:thiamine kinase-like enzyme